MTTIHIKLTDRKLREIFNSMTKDKLVGAMIEHIKDIREGVKNNCG